MRRSGSPISSPISAAVRSIVLVILYVAVRLTWSVRLYGLRHDPRVPSTYYAITHKRDFDSMAPIPPLLLHRGWRAVRGEVRFAMRSDSFTRGFLARVAPRPAWFAWLVRPFSVAWVVRVLGIMPLQKVTLAPLEEWLRDCRQVVGNAVASGVLAPATIEDLARAGRVDARTLARTPLSRLFRWRYHRALGRYVGPDALIGAARRATERRVATRARRYLTDISTWMQRGGSIYSAPEGQFSPDGHLSRITSGFNRVLHEAPVDACVVPVTIIYDFMTIGRARMFIDLAPAIGHAPTLSRDALNNRLRSAWMQAARYTCTQLASGLLVQAQLAGRDQIAATELAETVMRQAHDLHARGRSVDPRLLSRRGARGRVRRFLAFASRRGYVRRGMRGTWELLPFTLDMSVPPGEAGYHSTPLPYAWHELEDMGLPDAATGAAPDDALTA